ncbi:MAG: hypothetical protein HYU64_15480 [Armatimonadetes bacterium]|nr:hypothetical protein [Armatimonadota bacterium]
MKRIPSAVVGSVVKEPNQGAGPDFLVSVSLPPREKQSLIAEVKSAGEPRIAREAVNQLLRYCESRPGSYGVFVAPYISPRAAEICEKEGIGYVDLAGNCRLSFGHVYIEQQGTPNPFSQHRELRSIYSPKAVRVLRVLLREPQRIWKMQDLAREAGVSVGHVANVKERLSDQEWISTASGGLSLRDSGSVLKEWSRFYSYRKNVVRNFYSMKSVPEMEADLAKLCSEEEIGYALTGFSGASRYAPSVRHHRAMAYMNAITDATITGLELKEVPSGANMTLLVPYDEGIYYDMRVIDGVRVTSPIQTYLDLVSFRGRGEEAAQVLLDEVIKPAWPPGEITPEKQ